MSATGQPQTGKEYKVIGTRPVRHDGTDKVTGRAIYGADVQMSGLLIGKILRSPHAHAKIKAVDISKAEAMEGVFAVVTSADFPVHPPDVRANLGEGAVVVNDLARNCMARDKVFYKGHAVAAVAARDIHTAEEAIKAIDIEYEPLPAVVSLPDAMKDDAPLLHEDLFTNELGKMSEKPSNVSKHIRFKKGEIDRGFGEAEVIVEREFRTATVHQGYIEPQVATALWSQDDHLTLWSSTQGAFTVRHQTSAVLGLPISQVTVHPTEVGGAFGGKIRVYVEPVVSALSRKCGRPVRISLGRDEVFQGTGPAPGSLVRIKLGATRAGRIVAAQAWLAFEAGAFPSGIIGAGCMCVFGCYDLPNAQVDGYDVLLNKPLMFAYRAPGAPIAAFACESVIDELAEKLGLDPLDLRLANAAKEGTRRVDGPVYDRIGLIEALQAAKEHEHYQTPLEGPHRGRGVAAGFWYNVGLKSSATASVNSDGTVALTEGSSDLNSSRVVMAMQLAETLGIAAEDVRPQVGDTDTIGYTDVTGGSRATFATGWACYEAGQDIIRQMSERAAQIWECDPGAVCFESGVFRAGDQSITFKELAGKLNATGGPVIGRATVDPPKAGAGFGVHIADVEVDPETGKVQILRYTAVQDVGKAIHPSYVEGQIQGGAAQGIGWALNEGYFFDDKGHMRNASFLDYRMPTALDLPMIDTVLVEVPNPGHPFGVRGVGETPIVPPLATVAAAVYHATGARMQELPMAPHKISKAILQKSS